ncbi:uncharacterized protein LOC127934965 [Carassius gibelio]|uniref:uncharacterized protein LOC127934965 n=1 Tax=Carassius gibelio TaxID=101364 RepID=UPI0022788356|nr:uncharacterized protein LOC127934965 [Carassius gibelio]
MTGDLQVSNIEPILSKIIGACHCQRQKGSIHSAWQRSGIQIKEQKVWEKVSRECLTLVSREEHKTDTVGVASGLGEAFINRNHKTKGIKVAKRGKVSKITGNLVSSSCCGICVGRAVFIKEGSRQGAESGGRTRSPPWSGARAAASLSLAAALVGDGRPGILARRPCIRVRFPSGSRVRQLTSWWRGSPSTHPSWTHEDTSVHARGRDRSPEERRVGLLNSGGNEAPLPSGVPHHTPPALTRPAPLLSHTHSSREPGEGRRFRTGCR